MKNADFRSQFLKLMEHAEKTYHLYKNNGHTYQTACELKQTNLKIRNLLADHHTDLPPHLHIPARLLIEHYDQWIKFWEHHERSGNFTPDSPFIFDNPNHYPAAIAQSLTDYAGIENRNILFIGKDKDHNANLAAEYVRQIYPDTTVVFGNRGEQFPEELLWWQGDYIFSYLSPWIIPQTLLKRAAKGAINWHPGPPEYPGIGCSNFAIYNNEKTFGITCHFMATQVDSGDIIEVRRFPVQSADTVYSVTQKCYAHILCSFLSILENIVEDKPIPLSSERWKRKPFTRKELNALCEIEPTMPPDEIARRIKATSYDRPWAYISCHGINFHLK